MDWSFNVESLDAACTGCACWDRTIWEKAMFVVPGRTPDLPVHAARAEPTTPHHVIELAHQPPLPRPPVCSLSTTYRCRLLQLCRLVSSLMHACAALVEENPYRSTHRQSPQAGRPLLYTCSYDPVCISWSPFLLLFFFSPSSLPKRRLNAFNPTTTG